VTVEVGGVQAGEATTGSDGQFVFTNVPAGDVELSVSAPGFARARLSVTPSAGGIRIVLHPARLEDTVTVTASRGVEPFQTPESASVLTSAALANTAAGAVDDALRLTPGFSLFRRSSSRVANPSTQGVTLRGLSGSGASRSLVLADGLPLNDPFGSWVYWNRIPQAAIDRIEVVRGATGDLYGADALGGVIQIFTHDPNHTRLRASVEGASHATGRVSVFTGGRERGWTVSAAGELTRTDGVYVVAEDERGRADVAAWSDYQTAFVGLGYDTGGWRVSARGSVFREARGNGTPLQVNDTDWRQLSGEAAGSAGGGAWLVRAAGVTQDYFNAFSAVSADRHSERLTSDQRIATTFAHVGGQWMHGWGDHFLLFGAEARRVRSTMDERRYSFTSAVSGPFVSGGDELSGSIFTRASFAASASVTVAAGVRADFWHSEPRDSALPRHDVSFLSPRASVSWALRDGLTLRASIYHANRTPTLNELHRGFRVGNTVTNPNPLLDPERLRGVEGSALIASGRLSTRVTGFWNRLDKAVANITLVATPALITREKQNADRVRAAGVEAEADLRVNARLTVSGSVAITASHFSHTPKQPEIEGNRVPQVPRYQIGLTGTWVDPRLITISAQMRIAGLQYDDDRNELPLDAFGVIDLSASRALDRRLQVFLVVENLFDVEYDVGRTPVRTIGWPRTVRGGVRVFF
jgi:outer membrane receptor protein involved in Fe transport